MRRRLTAAIAAISAMGGAWLTVQTGQLHFLALVGLAPILFLMGTRGD